MTPEQLFQFINVLALLAWFFLLVLPNSKITKYGVASGAMVFLLSGIYLVLISGTFKMGNFDDFSSLEGVVALFTDPMGVVVGWAHYLAFDLFVGLWITLDAAKQGINRWTLLPCQLLTFMFGPIGLLVYIGIKTYRNKKLAPTIFS